MKRSSNTGQQIRKWRSIVNNFRSNERVLYSRPALHYYVITCARGRIAVSVAQVQLYDIVNNALM